MLGTSIQDIKTLARSRRLLATAQMPCEHVEAALQQARSQRIRRTGLRRYVHDMLRPVANRPVGECVLLDGNGQLIELLNGNGSLPLVDYLATHFTSETLPAVVLAHQDGQLREFAL